MKLNVTKTLWVVVIGLVLSMFAIPAAASAPKCRYPSFEEEYKLSEAVFVGRIVEETREGKRRYFTFRIEKYWKGVSTSKVTIYVSENRRYMSPYKMDESFLVFAKLNEEEDHLYDRRCSRSSLLNEYSPTVKNDLEKLGESGELAELDEKEVAKENE